MNIDNLSVLSIIQVRKQRFSILDLTELIRQTLLAMSSDVNFHIDQYWNSAVQCTTISTGLTTTLLIIWKCKLTNFTYFVFAMQNQN